MALTQSQIEKKLSNKHLDELLELWQSDESSLWDFHSDETNDKLVEKIHRIYGVDISDVSQRKSGRHFRPNHEKRGNESAKS